MEYLILMCTYTKAIVFRGSTTNDSLENNRIINQSVVSQWRIDNTDNFSQVVRATLRFSSSKWTNDWNDCLIVWIIWFELTLN